MKSMRNWSACERKFDDFSIICEQASFLRLKTLSGDQRHVVVIGGGFGGLEVVRDLRRADVRVTLVDRNNYHLFQPLLYQVATGALSPANITAPLRSVLRWQKNCQVIMAEVVDFDIENQRVILADGELQYDDLIVAAGASDSYFGHPEWKSAAPGMKSVEDALEIRRRIFYAFEAAEREDDPDLRAAWMTFVVVGGGPTGVELVGAIADIATNTLRDNFRNINPEDARILLLEGGEHVLGHYPVELCENAEAKLRKLGAEVHVKTFATDIQEDHVVLTCGDEQTRVPTKTVVWAAGVRANPLGEKLAAACGVECGRGGHVPVNEQLRVEGHDNIYVIGDIAACKKPEGGYLPGVAPVAIQQGSFVADEIKAEVSGKPRQKPFEYHDHGSMATIGRASAVADFSGWKFTGFFAWILWLFVHLILIVQFQNRILIFLQWTWYYMTYSRSARIITGMQKHQQDK
ncbi:NAD(P)/FAD-dependent oxidoreductase [Calycomorphotria hydatis]|uniref:NADH:ubiquinone reductase (non-electrogenic) n=1 Tax=Calycomorphotria hydatis TaxID=2528027 RepID=A0A517TF39_9PLAN|nr:NAD(P)/FAD-dependent oxidoreductase [Calycomorphotria hydatis]QDT66996.1 NADH dehydrogenase-like protein [Calycomorphotria hydatis]